MGRVQDLVIAELTAEIRSRTEWDEPPALFCLYVGDGKCRARQLPLPDTVWASAEPPRVLAQLADGSREISGLLQDIAPAGLHGAAFRCESWTVHGGAPGTRRAREVMAATQARQLHAHPSRVEQRTMWAVDRAGITYSVMQARGTGKVQQLVCYPKPGQPVISGNVPAALDRIVTAMLGVSLPARPRL